ncbi:MAG: hypothetical protein ACRDLM_03900 [Gaiellaceae bacterium]
MIRAECQLGRDGTRSPLKTEESRRAIDIPPKLMRRLVALTRERDTTLRIYAHEWKYNAARRSQVGRQLGELFEDRRQLTAPERKPLALPPAGGTSSQEA